ncbi:thioredoxin family protein [Enterococcus caccae]|uniref:Thioredoxin domain-containing protein n=1 Tax=Enterococcus caccae ATCC BAA-1240 TaxID=1158612 RepID=R3TTS6_9ENTE|nr:thioredoxin family protein [Enterococcus caccae]EOL44568.1 hypothetical protein UC7_02111 [Enterococcus caccae ATCC BAA-1240]EOT58711.1 hypothetical protein I580_02883 [Enterococcus caccae ATCC BAA-1240]OJG25943.1 hypothetical protein RU98_GL000820 [Enterococcus caccae]
MKKYWYVITSVIAVLGCFLYQFGIRAELATQKEKLIAEQKKYPEIYDVLNSMTIENFENEVSEKKELIVYVGRPTCQDCTEFEPKLIEMLKKYELQDKVEYLNVAQIRKDERDWENFKAKYHVEYTPAIVNFKEGKLVTMVNWTPEKGTEMEQFDNYLNNLKKQLLVSHI